MMRRGPSAGAVDATVDSLVSGQSATDLRTYAAMFIAWEAGVPSASLAT